MTPLGQRDPRWAKQQLGTSNTTIGSHGCTITCLAMLIGTTPDVVNRKLSQLPKDKNGNTGFAKGNLVVWSRVPEAFPNLTFVKRVSYYDNEDVKANIPCLVEVDFDNSPVVDNRHWVLFIGNKRLNDPWTGSERATSVYTILKGYAIYKKKSDTIINEVVDNKPTPATSVDPLPTVNPEDNSQPIDSGPNSGGDVTDIRDSQDVPSGDTSPATTGSDTPTVIVPDTSEEVAQESPKAPSVQFISLKPLKTLWSALINLLKRLVGR